jgi:hypothetical protein
MLPYASFQRHTQCFLLHVSMLAMLVISFPVPFVLLTSFVLLISFTRSTAVHVLNSSSSRSHALFSVYVETRASAEASERALLSKLHLVDLAGSERTKKTNPSGEQLREASCINKSLTFLEQVVNALARKDNHVPFR